jgi:hypothetical protein
MRPETLRLERYTPGLRSRWNKLVRASKNGTFLLEREFMEYHQDRFEDASLVAIEGSENLVGLLPAARERQVDGDWLNSHPGLTYGGWVVDARMTTSGMLRLFELLREWARAERMTGLRYRPAPRPYHRIPADEDIYALFVNRAGLVRQDLGSVIDLRETPGWSKGRRQSLAKARAAGVQVLDSDDVHGFMALLTDVLAAHDAKPVHTVAELAMLRGLFPDQIRLYAATLGAESLAYVLAFDCGRTVHTQYMANGAEGRQCGALEAIIDHLQNTVYRDRHYLSFGISTERGGLVLNHGLTAQKEMFGARAIVSPAYEMRFSI